MSTNEDDSTINTTTVTVEEDTLDNYVGNVENITKAIGHIGIVEDGLKATFTDVEGVIVANETAVVAVPMVWIGSISISLRAL